MIPFMLIFLCTSKTRKKDTRMVTTIDKVSSTMQEAKLQKQKSNKQDSEQCIKSAHRSTHSNNRKPEMKKLSTQLKEINVDKKHQKNSLNITKEQSLENPRKSSMEIEKTQSITEAEKTQSTVASLTAKVNEIDTNNKKYSLKCDRFGVKGIEKNVTPIPNTPIEEKTMSALNLKKAIEVVQPSIFKDLSGQDDLPLPEAEFEDTTQPSNSIRMNDEDDTGENVGELREDIEQSEDE